MKKHLFNGLSNKEASIFYHFLCIYEQSVKPYLSTEVFRQLYPKATEIIDKLDIEILSKKKYLDMPNRIQGEKIILIGNKNKKEYEFFRHLRNALAHGLLRKTQTGYYIYEDMIEKNNGQKTALCRVKKEKIDDIFKVILVEYWKSIKNNQ